MTTDDPGQMLLDDALERVEEHADEGWKIAAQWALWDEIHEHGLGHEFTTDELHRRLEAKGVSTHEPRALGAIVRKAAKAGYIVNTERTRKTSRPQSHKRPMTVWRVIKVKQDVAA